ncbi:MAG: ammonium transporter, partial [Thermodesulfobacteriota bacterium]
MGIKRKFILPVGIFLTLLFPVVVQAADPTGSLTFREELDGLKTSIDFSWTLIAAALVFFMQAGFAFLGAGLLRSKNTLNYLTKSYLDFSAAALSFWAFGFALMFGGSKIAPGLMEGNSWIGFSGFFLTGKAYDVTTAMIWMFQMVFAATAATIVAGAVAERLKFQAYLIYSFIVCGIIY